MSATAPAANNDLTVSNSEKSENNCDASNDVVNSVIDTSGIKVEIKDEPDIPKSVNNIQPALGGSLLPPHAANAKHPVSIIYCLHSLHALKIFRFCILCSRSMVQMFFVIFKG